MDNLPLRCFLIRKYVYEKEAGDFLLKNAYFMYTSVSLRVIFVSSQSTGPLSIGKCRKSG
jgi:hypothetical protein